VVHLGFFDGMCGWQVSAYCTSKWAVEGLTRSLAKELPKGMAAVALSPGVLNTELLTSCFGASAALYPSPESWYDAFSINL